MPEDAKHVRPSLLSAMIVLVLSGTMADVAYGAVPRPGTTASADDQHAADDASVSMVLDVSINATRTHELLNVLRKADGSFSATAGDLRRLRLKLDDALPADAHVRLDSIPGLRATYDEAQQSLDLQAPDALMDAYEVQLGGEPNRTDLGNLQTIPAAILNYDLNQHFEDGRNVLSGEVEALATGRFGIVRNTAIYNGERTGQYDKAVRLDSSWHYVDPVAVRSYTLGDLTTNTVAWSNSVRLAGFQIASAFDQRSDIVTAALPQFSGSAALPSTLDLYVNQQRVYSGEIPSGPFDLKSLPYVSGGDVTLVTTDATGRQVTTTQSYYYTPDLLRQGITQYSFEIGVPRFNYGLLSSDYDDTVFASGSYRHGLRAGTTVEGHAEFSADGLANIGGGLVQSLAGRGALSAAVAGSSYKDWHGSLASLSLEGQIGGVRAYASTQRTFGDYFDLGRVSTLRYNERNLDILPSALTAYSQSMAEAIDRAGIAFTPGIDPTSINLSYNRIRYPGEDLRTANLSLSRSITPRISGYLNAYTSIGGTSDYGVYLMLTFTWDKGISGSVGAKNTNGHIGYIQQASGSTGQRLGGSNWGVSSTLNEGDDDQLYAYFSYRARQALLTARSYRIGDVQSFELEAQGSLLAAQGSVFATNTIGDAYAIVTNAGPDVEVMQGGVKIGRTNQAGMALLPNIRPYYEQQVYIDPATLPDGWEPEVTERTAVAGYRQGARVDFGAKSIHGAVVILHDSKGMPLPAGHSVKLDDGQTALIGYDGQVYLRGLKTNNHLTVDLGIAGQCAASFRYDESGPTQPTLGPLTCE